MRYICDHPRIEILLRAWSSSTPLTISKFFFWNSGTKEQRSLSGLLRAILHSVLEAHPELLPIVLPWQWAKRYSTISSGNAILPSQSLHDWSLSKLQAAFEKLCDQKEVRLKLCIFIDGLDEYEGDPEIIPDLFYQITSKSSDIKICAASRPLVVFGEAFAGYPTLRLQDLTLWDIEFYVTDNLSKHRRFRQLLEKEPVESPRLMKDIVDRAVGVFLWVRLVVESLREGLGNHDEISDLRQRLDELPRDLEQLYHHMWCKTHTIYLERASRLFQIVRASRNHGTLIGAKSDDVEPLTVIALSFAEEESTTLKRTSPLAEMDEDEIRARCEKVETALKTRCAGLLEVQVSDRPETSGGRVQYLHRTARDYVEGSEIWPSIIAYTSGTNFNPHLSLLKSSVLQLKHTITSPMSVSLWRTATSALEDAYLLEKDTNIPYTALLDELDGAMNHRVGGRDNRVGKSWDCDRHWINHTFNPYSHVPSWKSDFLSLAVQCGLTSYTSQKLGKGNRVLERKPGRPLLSYAVEDPDSEFGKPPPSRQMLELLLKHGATIHSGLGWGPMRVEKEWLNALADESMQKGRVCLLM